MDKKISEISSGWRMYFIKNSDCRSFADSVMRESELLSRGEKAIPATIPGNFELDLYNAGLIPDPFFGDNPLKLQYLEAMHVWYCADFVAEDVNPHTYLRFEGLDTVADVYLNGEKILSSSNMFIPYDVRPDTLKNGRNELLVHFKPVCIEARKYVSPASSNALWYNYQGLYIRKAAYMYGWDILPRFVSCGIFKPIYIMEEKPDAIKDVFVYTLYTDEEKNEAKLRIYFDLRVSDDLIQNYKIRFSGSCGNSSFCEEITPWGTQYNRMAFIVRNAKLWWPKGYGEPALYDCRAELYLNGKSVDTHALTVGIRTVMLDRSECVGDDGRFCFSINGKRIFFRGTNWIPTDPFPSRIASRLPSALSLLDGLGVNSVRMWGGGVYESDEFYNFCDRRGIMVWQDFMMACAVYPQDEKFCDIIKDEIVYQICRLRPHPCLVLWAGDNECDCTYQSWGGIRRDPNENIITRKLIPSLVRAHDFSRPYLPSSPYISPECHRTGKASPEGHLWGPRSYFRGEFYTSSECLFASEIGYHGCASPDSVAKFIGKDYIYPLTRDNGDINPHWLAHATETAAVQDGPYSYRLKLMTDQVRLLFGSLPDNICDFAKQSQISQAEALKFFIESFRAKKWDRTGIMFWNLLDGWPQSSDAVVDYYGVKKLAYHFLVRSLSPLCLMIAEKDGGATLYASNDTSVDHAVSFTVRNLYDGKIALSGSAVADANSSYPLGSFELPDDDRSFYLIEWTADGKTYKNHYHTGIIGIDYEKYMKALKESGFDEFEGFPETK